MKSVLKFYRIGEFQDDVLKRLVEIAPSQRVGRSVFSRLNYLLGFIEKHSPEHLQPFIDKLESKYSGMISEDFVSKAGIDLTSILAEWEHLKKHKSLARLALNYYTQVLGIDANAWDQTAEVVNRNYHQAFLHPRYYNLLSLMETMGREEAIKLWKRFFTDYVKADRTPRETPFVDLETWFNERLEAAETAETLSEWVMVRGMIADGKFAYRNDNCFWVESLDDLPDSELKYYICCYGDYEGARDLHPSIVLTMEHTIAQGHPYCSRVLHDTRVDYDLRHPPKEFWDSMAPDEPN